MELSSSILKTIKFIAAIASFHRCAFCKSHTVRNDPLSRSRSRDRSSYCTSRYELLNLFICSNSSLKPSQSPQISLNAVYNSIGQLKLSKLFHLTSAAHISEEICQSPSWSYRRLQEIEKVYILVNFIYISKDFISFEKSWRQKLPNPRTALSDPQNLSKKHTMSGGHSCRRLAG